MGASVGAGPGANVMNFSKSLSSAISSSLLPVSAPVSGTGGDINSISISANASSGARTKAKGKTRAASGSGVLRKDGDGENANEKEEEKGKKKAKGKEKEKEKEKERDEDSLHRSPQSVRSVRSTRSTRSTTNPLSLALGLGPPRPNPRMHTSEAERIKYFQAHPAVAQIEPYRALCQMCGRWLKLANATGFDGKRASVRYKMSNWIQHGKVCWGRGMGDKWEEEEEGEEEVEGGEEGEGEEGEGEGEGTPSVASVSASVISVPASASAVSTQFRSYSHAYSHSRPASVSLVSARRRINAMERRQLLCGDELSGEVREEEVYCMGCGVWVRLVGQARTSVGGGGEGGGGEEDKGEGEGGGGEDVKGKGKGKAKGKGSRGGGKYVLKNWIRHVERIHGRRGYAFVFTHSFQLPTHLFYSILFCIFFFFSTGLSLFVNAMKLCDIQRRALDARAGCKAEACARERCTCG